MALPVSSHFQSKLDSTNPSSQTFVFTFDGTDRTAKVIEIPTIKRDSNQVIGKDFSIRLENASQTFNTFITSKTNFLKTGTFDFGFATESGTVESIQLYGGVLQRTDFDETEVTLLFDDRLTKLKDRKIGTSTEPVSFVSVNPASMYWAIVTSYGGLDTTASSLNTDLDYDSWVRWVQGLEGDQYRVSAHFPGTQVVDAIDKIARITDSTIYAEGDNKLYTLRNSAVGSDTFTLTDSTIVDVSDMTIRADQILNKVDVNIGWNPATNSWESGVVTSQKTGSVSSYGEFQTQFDDTNVWHTTSLNGLNLASRITFRRAEPNINVKIKTPLTTMAAQLSDEISVTTNIYSLSNYNFFLQGYTKDIKNGMVTLEADEGFSKGGGRLKGFILDVVTFSALDQTYNPLF